MRSLIAEPLPSDGVKDSFSRRLDASSKRPIAVAVSGGGDSIFALRRTVEWANAAGRPVVVLHVDHQLQPQSAAWAATVADAAVALGAQVQILTWDGDKPARGLPAAARQARQRMLADAARAADAVMVVTGHTADDALENARLGQGPLSEWSPSPVWPEGRGLFLLRPLLAMRRDDIRDRLRAEDATWIDDPTNFDPAQPRIAARRAITAEAVPRLEVTLTNDAAGLARAAMIRDAVIALPRDAVLAASPVVRRKVLATALVSAGGGERLPRTAALERIIERLARKEAFTATLCGARLEAGDDVTVMRDIGAAARSGLRTVGPIWDGRYDASAINDPIHPLKGLAGALPSDQRSRLRRLPPAARAALPAVVVGAGVTCPILAQPPSLAMPCLVGGRFAAACGALSREGDLIPGAHGAMGSAILC